MTAELLVDVVLALSLLWLAWRVLTTEDLFQEAILFIGFGLVMALVWARLGAPDIALAEAAIGAGLTGALVLDAVGQMNDRARESRPKDSGDAERAGGTILGRLLDAGPAIARRPITGLVLAGAAMALAATVFAVPMTPGGLTETVLGRLDAAAVSQPVTAVLLDFRLFDTWLEIGVLVLAMVVVLTVRGAADLTTLRALPPASPILLDAARLLVPVVFLVAGYLLWLGTHEPGGALQAGTVLGAGGVLVREAGFRSVAAVAGRLLRPLVVSAFALTLGVGAWALAAERPFLELPGVGGETTILVLELVAGISVGAILASLFAGTQPGAHEVEEMDARWRT